MEKFDPLDYWGRLAIHLSEENTRLRQEILNLQIVVRVLNQSNSVPQKHVKGNKDGI